MEYESEVEDDFGATTQNLGVHNDSDHNPFEYHVPDWFFYAMSVVCPIVILCGMFANIFAFVVLVRSHLSLIHEGYLYLAAIFSANAGVLLACTGSLWFTYFYGNGHYYPPNTSAFMCKYWHFLTVYIHATSWLSVALLFNVYLRTFMRRCACPKFAAKYCTLFATNIIVGVALSASLVFGLLYLAIFELYPEGECLPSQRAYVYVVGFVDGIVLWALPYFFLPIVLGIVLIDDRKGNTLDSRELDDRSLSAYAEQMRVLALTLYYIIAFSQLGRMSLEHNYVDNAVAFVVIGLAFALSLVLQPIMCFIILTNLRDGFRLQLRNVSCCRRQLPSLDRDEDEVVQLTSIQEDPTSATESYVDELDLHTFITHF